MNEKKDLPKEPFIICCRYKHIHDIYSIFDHYDKKKYTTSGFILKYSKNIEYHHVRDADKHSYFVHHNCEFKQKMDRPKQSFSIDWFSNKPMKCIAYLNQELLSNNSLLNYTYTKYRRINNTKSDELPNQIFPYANKCNSTTKPEGALYC